MSKVTNYVINPWFKFYGSEFLSDPKVGALTAQERSCWITLLCLSSSSTTPGTIEYLTVEVLLEKSGIHFDPYHPEEWNNCLGILTKFEKIKMLQTSTDGKITISNWEKRQESSLTNAERQARYRENKKSNEKVTSVITKVTLEKKRKEEKRREKKEDNATKVAYGEFLRVFLTEDEYKKLVERLGETNTGLMIVELDTYLASKNKKYSSHYATILSWVRRKLIDYKKTKSNVAF